MASRIDLAKQYMDYQREQKMDEMMDMMADDIEMTNPMTGTVKGKDALKQQMQNRPAGGGGGGGMNLTRAAHSGRSRSRSGSTTRTRSARSTSA